MTPQEQAAKTQRWLRQRKRDRITLIISAVLVAAAYVASFYLPNLFGYLLRFGPLVFIAVIIEDAWAVRRERRRNHESD